MRVLYLTHNGLTEPLGQSQVLPYLRGVARRGAQISVLSFEPADATERDLARVAEQTASDGVRWDSIRRSPQHDLATKVREATTALALAGRLAVTARPRIVHTRSWIFGPVIEAIATLVPGARMLFDCRGLLAEEYVDVGHWREDELKARLLRRFERHALRRADGLVFLTRTLRDLLREQGRLADAPVEVIPCCVDVERFVPDDAARTAVRAEIGAGDAPVVVYSGSLSGWYLVEEMAQLVGQLRRELGALKWLVLSRSPTDELLARAGAHGVPSEDIIVRKASPFDMPRWLAAGDVGLSLIKPCFSKLGSSPTKVAEYLAVGMPAIVNAGIGDQADLARSADGCVVTPDVTTTSLEAAARAAARILKLDRARRVAASRALARDEFDVTNVGIARYDRLYRALDR